MGYVNIRFQDGTELRLGASAEREAISPRKRVERRDFKPIRRHDPWNDPEVHDPYSSLCEVVSWR